MQANRSPLLTPVEAAAFLRRCKHTLAIWRVHGTGPRFVKIGSKVAYRRQDLEAFIEGAQFDSTSEYTDVDSRPGARPLDRAAAR
jgi:hypothetical protein